MKMAAAVLCLMAMMLGSTFATEKPEVFVQLGHQGGGCMQTFQFSQNLKYLVTGGSDMKVILWDVTSGMEVRKFEGHAAKIKAVAVSSDGRLVLSGDMQGTIKLWDATTGEQIRSMTVEGKGSSFLSHLSFSPDDHFFTSVGNKSGMIMWNVSTGQAIKNFGRYLQSSPSSYETSVLMPADSKEAPNIRHLIEISSGK
ncbi:MAG: hypothetical protein M0Q01_09325, partial [Syntrophales bacterium]|nr:hypothetical protein [Syntrophales bacterium]